MKLLQDWEKLLDLNGNNKSNKNQYKIGIEAFTFGQQNINSNSKGKLLK